jgi:hypothetical protein
VRAEVPIHAHHSLFYGVAVLAGHTILYGLRGVMRPFISLYDLACLAGFAYPILARLAGQTRCSLYFTAGMTVI